MSDKDDADRFADPTVCSAASGEQLPVNRLRSTAEIVAALASLTDEQRMEVFRHFCVMCGGIEKPCYCCWDE